MRAGARRFNDTIVPKASFHSINSRPDIVKHIPRGPPFHGRVTSKEPACVPNRKVVLLEVAPDHGPIDLADNRTNGKGKWVFSSQLQGATIVQAKVTQSKASGVTCRSARSPAKPL